MFVLFLLPPPPRICAPLTPQQTNPKSARAVKKALDKAYNYLGGNAFGRDKKGNIKDDVGDLGGLMGETEYSAYCYFEFEVA